jgi:hypothetical protein
MDEQGFALAEQSCIGYQLPGAAEVEAETAEIVENLESRPCLKNMEG